MIETVFSIDDEETGTTEEGGSGDGSDGTPSTDTPETTDAPERLLQDGDDKEEGDKEGDKEGDSGDRENA